MADEEKKPLQPVMLLIPALIGGVIGGLFTGGIGAAVIGAAIGGLGVAATQEFWGKAWEAISQFWSKNAPTLPAATEGEEQKPGGTEKKKEKDAPAQSNLLEAAQKALEGKIDPKTPYVPSDPASALNVASSRNSTIAFTGLLYAGTKILGRGVQFALDWTGLNYLSEKVLGVRALWKLDHWFPSTQTPQMIENSAKAAHDALVTRQAKAPSETYTDSEAASVKKALAQKDFHDGDMQRQVVNYEMAKEAARKASSKPRAATEKPGAGKGAGAADAGKPGVGKPDPAKTAPVKEVVEYVEIKADGKRNAAGNADPKDAPGKPRLRIRVAGDAARGQPASTYVIEPGVDLVQLAKGLPVEPVKMALATQAYDIIMQDKSLTPEQKNAAFTKVTHALDTAFDAAKQGKTPPKVTPESLVKATASAMTEEGIGIMTGMEWNFGVTEQLTGSRPQPLDVGKALEGMKLNHQVLVEKGINETLDTHTSEHIRALREKMTSKQAQELAHRYNAELERVGGNPKNVAAEFVTKELLDVTRASANAAATEKPLDDKKKIALAAPAPSAKSVTNIAEFLESKGYSKLVAQEYAVAIENTLKYHHDPRSSNRDAGFERVAATEEVVLKTAEAYKAEQEKAALDKAVEPANPEAGKVPEEFLSRAMLRAAGVTPASESPLTPHLDAIFKNAQPSSEIKAHEQLIRNELGAKYNHLVTDQFNAKVLLLTPEQVGELVSSHAEAIKTARAAATEVPKEFVPNKIIELAGKNPEVLKMMKEKHWSGKPIPRIGYVFHGTAALMGVGQLAHGLQEGNIGETAMGGGMTGAGVLGAVAESRNAAIFTKTVAKNINAAVEIARTAGATKAELDAVRMMVTNPVRNAALEAMPKTGWGITGSAMGGTFGLLEAGMGGAGIYQTYRMDPNDPMHKHRGWDYAMNTGHMASGTTMAAAALAPYVGTSTMAASTVQTLAAPASYVFAPVVAASVLVNGFEVPYFEYKLFTGLRGRLAELEEQFQRGASMEVSQLRGAGYIGATPKFDEYQENEKYTRGTDRSYIAPGAYLQTQKALQHLQEWEFGKALIAVRGDKTLTPQQADAKLELERKRVSAKYERVWAPGELKQALEDWQEEIRKKFEAMAGQSKMNELLPEINSKEPVTLDEAKAATLARARLDDEGYADAIGRVDQSVKWMFGYEGFNFDKDLKGKVGSLEVLARKVETIKNALREIEGTKDVEIGKKGEPDFRTERMFHGRTHVYFRPDGEKGVIEVDEEEYKKAREGSKPLKAWEVKAPDLSDTPAKGGQTQYSHEDYKELSVIGQKVYNPETGRFNIRLARAVEVNEHEVTVRFNNGNEVKVQPEIAVPSYTQQYRNTRAIHENAEALHGAAVRAELAQVKGTVPEKVMTSRANDIARLMTKLDDGKTFDEHKDWKKNKEAPFTKDAQKRFAYQSTSLNLPWIPQNQMGGLGVTGVPQVDDYFASMTKLVRSKGDNGTLSHLDDQKPNDKKLKDFLQAEYELNAIKASRLVMQSAASAKDINTEFNGRYALLANEDTFKKLDAFFGMNERAARETGWAAFKEARLAHSKATAQIGLMEDGEEKTALLAIAESHMKLAMPAISAQEIARVTSPGFTAFDTKIVGMDKKQSEFDTVKAEVAGYDAKRAAVKAAEEKVHKAAQVLKLAKQNLAAAAALENGNIENRNVVDAAKANFAAAEKQLETDKSELEKAKAAVDKTIEEESSARQKFADISSDAIALVYNKHKHPGNRRKDSKFLLPDSIPESALVAIKVFEELKDVDAGKRQEVFYNIALGKSGEGFTGDTQRAIAQMKPLHNLRAMVATDRTRWVRALAEARLMATGKEENNILKLLKKEKTDKGKAKAWDEYNKKVMGIVDAIIANDASLNAAQRELNTAHISMFLDKELGNESSETRARLAERYMQLAAATEEAQKTMLENALVEEIAALRARDFTNRNTDKSMANGYLPAGIQRQLSAYYTDDEIAKKFKVRVLASNDAEDLVHFAALSQHLDDTEKLQSLLNRYSSRLGKRAIAVMGESAEKLDDGTLIETFHNGRVVKTLPDGTQVEVRKGAAILGGEAAPAASAAPEKILKIQPVVDDAIVTEGSVSGKKSAVTAVSVKYRDKDNNERTSLVPLKKGVYANEDELSYAVLMAVDPKAALKFKLEKQGFEKVSVLEENGKFIIDAVDNRLDKAEIKKKRQELYDRYYVGLNGQPAKLPALIPGATRTEEGKALEAQYKRLDEELQKMPLTPHKNSASKRYRFVGAFTDSQTTDETRSVTENGKTVAVNHIKQVKPAEFKFEELQWQDGDGKFVAVKTRTRGEKEKNNMLAAGEEKLAAAKQRLDAARADERLLDFDYFLEPGNSPVITLNDDLLDRGQSGLGGLLSALISEDTTEERIQLAMDNTKIHEDFEKTFGEALAEPMESVRSGDKNNGTLKLSAKITLHPKGESGKDHETQIVLTKALARDKTDKLLQAVTDKARPVGDEIWNADFSKLGDKQKERAKAIFGVAAARAPVTGIAIATPDGINQSMDLEAGKMVVTGKDKVQRTLDTAAGTLSLGQDGKATHVVDLKTGILTLHAGSDKEEKIVLTRGKKIQVEIAGAKMDLELTGNGEMKITDSSARVQHINLEKSASLFNEIKAMAAPEFDSRLPGKGESNAIVTSVDRLDKTSQPLQSKEAKRLLMALSHSADIVPLHAKKPEAAKPASPSVDELKQQNAETARKIAAAEDIAKAGKLRADALKEREKTERKKHEDAAAEVKNKLLEQKKRGEEAKRAGAEKSAAEAQRKAQEQAAAAMIPPPVGGMISLGELMAGGKVMVFPVNGGAGPVTPAGKQTMEIRINGGVAPLPGNYKIFATGNGANVDYFTVIGGTPIAERSFTVAPRMVNGGNPANGIEGDIVEGAKQALRIGAPGMPQGQQQGQQGQQQQANGFNSVNEVGLGAFLPAETPANADGKTKGQKIHEA